MNQQNSINVDKYLWRFQRSRFKSSCNFYMKPNFSILISNLLRDWNYFHDTFRRIWLDKILRCQQESKLAESKWDAQTSRLTKRVRVSTKTSKWSLKIWKQSVLTFNPRAESRGTGLGLKITTHPQIRRGTTLPVGIAGNARIFTRIVAEEIADL